MEKNYDFLLPFFVVQGTSKGLTTTPYDGMDGYIYATNSEAVIRVPKENVSGRYNHPKGYPDVKGVFDRAANAPGNRTATIEYADFLAALTGPGRPAFLKIGSQVFPTHLLRTIFAVSVFAESERITYRADDGINSPGLFEIEGGVTILLFPTNLRSVQAGEVKMQ